MLKNKVIIIEYTLVVNLVPTAAHLSAVQGRAEQRTELYVTIQRRSSTSSDAVMRRESVGMPSYAGQQDGWCVGVASRRGRLGLEGAVSSGRNGAAVPAQSLLGIFDQYHYRYR